MFATWMLMVGVVVGSGQEQRANVRTVKEETLVGSIGSFSREAGLVLETESGERKLPTEDLVELSFPESNAVRATPVWTLRASNGDELHATQLEGAGANVTMQALGVGRMSLPVDSIALLLRHESDEAARRAVDEWVRRMASQSEDCLLLANGDTISGFLTGIEGEELLVDTKTGASRIPLRSMNALRLVAESPTMPKTPYLVLNLRSGGRISTSEWSWSGDRLRVSHALGSDSAVALNELAAVSIVGGRWEWLSLIADLRHEHTPMLSATWPMRRDRNVSGGPLVVAGESFDRGIGVHSKSVISADLNGRYTSLITYFGIDDESGSKADVDVAVVVDGKIAFEQNGVGRGKLFGPVRLSLEKAKSLELRVGFGQFGDMHDRFDWIRTALVK